MKNSCVAALIVLALSPWLAGAEKSTIFGQVTDPIGAVITHAKITVQWDSVGAQVAPPAELARGLTATTNDVGSYEVHVPVGFYEVTVSSPGFKPRAAKVRVREGERSRFDTRLAIDPEWAASRAGSDYGESAKDRVDLIWAEVDESLAPNAELCGEQSRPDCLQAVAFFDELQKAIQHDDRSTVASMAHFPLRVRLHGRNSVIKNKAQLLREYDKVFDQPVRCAISHASRTKVWGNWQGFTVADGVVWWERGAAQKSPFRIITVNNEAFYEGCGGGETGSAKVR